MEAPFLELDVPWTMTSISESRLLIILQPTIYDKEQVFNGFYSFTIQRFQMDPTWEGVCLIKTLHCTGSTWVYFPNLPGFVRPPSCAGVHVHTQRGGLAVAVAVWGSPHGSPLRGSCEIHQP